MMNVLKYAEGCFKVSFAVVQVLFLNATCRKLFLNATWTCARFALNVI